MKIHNRAFTGSLKGSIRVMTYNVLTQTMGSSFRYRKIGNKMRFRWIYNEIKYYNPDIIFLQEVDQRGLQQWDQFFTASGWQSYSCFYPKKLHGICVAWKKNKFVLRHTSPVLFDKDDTIPTQDLKSTHCGMVLALKSLMNNDDETIVVSTAHLTWKPQFDYERLRQFTILLNEIDRVKNSFKTDLVIIGADFNATVDSPLYKFVAASNQITEDCFQQLQLSANSGRSQDESQQISLEPLLAAARTIETKLASCYKSVTGSEPIFTNWTDDFRETIDYIFVSEKFVPGKVLVTPSPSELGPDLHTLPGIVEERVYPSDHIPLVAIVKRSETKKDQKADSPNQHRTAKEKKANDLVARTERLTLNSDNNASTEDKKKSPGKVNPRK